MESKRFLKSAKSFFNDVDGMYDSSDYLSSDGSMSDGSSGSAEDDPEFVIIKKSRCTCCDDAIKLLTNRNKTFDAREREPTQLENQAMTDAKKKNYQFFPKIFRYENNKLKFIGGFTDLKKII